MYKRIPFAPQFQAQKTERLIRKDFETLRQFLQEEEDKSIAALREEAEKKMGNVEERVEQKILSLLDKVRDVEEKLENDDVTFLQVIIVTPIGWKCMTT